MATAVVIAGRGTWVGKGRHMTQWDNLMINTTGDVGSVQGAYDQMSLLSIYVTGTLTSVSVLQFQESPLSTGVFSVGQTVCGTDLSFDGTTGAGLSTGITYMMRPGGSYFKPRMTAGASGAEDVSVVFVQARG